MAELRMEVLLEAERTGVTVTEVCRRYGISRQTYYLYRRDTWPTGSPGWRTGLGGRCSRRINPGRARGADLRDA